MATATFPPTPEQQDAIDLAAEPGNLAIEALAGAGKTTTLRMIADTAMAGRRGQYIAFNKKIVTDAQASFPSSVACSTAHSLAFKGIGYRFRDRLNDRRRSGAEQARSLDLDPDTQVVIDAGDQTHELAPERIASLAAQTVDRFCQTGEAEIGVRHVPFVRGLDKPGGSSYPGNDRVAEIVAPLARVVWRSVQDPDDDRFRFTHGHYLKMWERMGPVIDADYILFDECQPPDTMVELAGGRGRKRIADLKVGERVVSYTKGRVLSTKFGSVVEGKTITPYSGDMVVCHDSERGSRYTPNHRCMARIGDALEGKTILYLMRHADGRYRIGVTKARHGTGPGRNFGIVGRLREEGGDAAWILDAYDSRAEALAAEECTSLLYRIPQARFGSAKFWAGWAMTYSDPAGCLSSFGRDERWPLIESGRRYMMADRFTEVRAANMMPGFQMMSLDGGLRPVDVYREPYEGPVVSLSVSGPATYVADGIVTHNCQDANPVMRSIVEAQANLGTKVIWVGDTHQQIYSFTGAVNALADVDVAYRTFLTQSFRFGEEIAAAANLVLGRLGATETLIGSGPAGTVGPIDDVADVYLARTNGGAIGKAIWLMGEGHRVYIQGGMDPVVRFCEAALQLIATGRTSHPEISCFASWSKVVDYVEEGGDPAAGDLRLMVNLVEDYGARELIDILAQTERSPRSADVTVSTAHKSKGAEWDRVQLIGDFPPAPEAEELRLLYVAATRAKLHLDADAVDLSGTRAATLRTLVDGFDPQNGGDVVSVGSHDGPEEYPGNPGPMIADPPSHRLMGSGLSDERRGNR